MSVQRKFDQAVAELMGKAALPPGSWAPAVRKAFGEVTDGTSTRRVTAVRDRAMILLADNASNPLFGMVAAVRAAIKEEVAEAAGLPDTGFPVII